jgi:SAM-dependent methyltransferase
VRGGRLLEIGSGLGHLVGQLEDSFKTYGMDLNHWAVKESKSVIEKTALQTASAQEIPFADGAFDVVIIKHIVEHLPDPEKAVAELGRVTAPGGVLILATPNLDSLLKPWKGEKWIGYQDPTHISLKPPSVWLDWIVRSGFSLETRLRGRVLGCAVCSGSAEANPETAVWLAGRLAGHHRVGVPAGALGGEYDCDCAETLISFQ